MIESEKRLRQGVAWIELNRMPHVGGRGVITLTRELIVGRKRAEITVIGVEIAGRLDACAVDFGLRDRRLYSAGHPRCHFVLQLEHVFQRTVDFFAP